MYSGIRFYKNYKITTLQQVKFWLEQGEIVVIKLSNAEAYLEKRKSKLIFTIQPYIGRSEILEN